MKRYALISGAMALAICTALVVADAQAQKQRSRAGELDEKTSGTNVRASQLIGMNIVNFEGESLGEVNDLVIDAQNGRIRYAAVEYGGFLGLGDKLFAVPFEAFEVRPEEDDPDDMLLVLNVNQETLEGATGFDDEHWPNFADPKFTSEIDKRYGIERRRGGKVDVNINRKGVDVNIEKKNKNQDE
ncbi:MAG: PRC-barrel domain-containing protein [Planctomycetaceae bacterium]